MKIVRAYQADVAAQLFPYIKKEDICVTTYDPDARFDSNYFSSINVFASCEGLEMSELFLRGRTIGEALEDVAGNVQVVYIETIGQRHNADGTIFRTWHTLDIMIMPE